MIERHRLIGDGDRDACETAVVEWAHVLGVKASEMALDGATQRQHIHDGVPSDFATTSAAAASPQQVAQSRESPTLPFASMFLVHLLAGWRLGSAQHLRGASFVTIFGVFVILHEFLMLQIQKIFSIIIDKIVVLR